MSDAVDYSIYVGSWNDWSELHPICCRLTCADKMIRQRINLRTNVDGAFSGWHFIDCISSTFCDVVWTSDLVGFLVLYSP
jgi:hypothetical protein